MNVVTVCGELGFPFVEVLEGAVGDAIRDDARGRCDGRWPTWSRSYAVGVAVVAGWVARVGVDVEWVEADGEHKWPRKDIAAGVLLTASETSAFDDAEARGCAPTLTDVWSSKEALAKALGSPIDYDPARLDAPALWPGESLGRWRSRRIAHRVEGKGELAVWIVYEVADYEVNA